MVWTTEAALAGLDRRASASRLQNVLYIRDVGKLRSEIGERHGATLAAFAKNTEDCVSMIGIHAKKSGKTSSAGYRC